MRNILLLVFSLLILFSVIWIVWDSRYCLKNRVMQNDIINLGTIAKALIIYSDTQGYNFPNLGTSVIDPSGHPDTITNPKLAMKALVWSGIIENPKCFDSVENGMMTDAQLKANIDLSCSSLYNDYYYSFGPEVRLRSDSNDICVSVQPNAYSCRNKQVLIIAFCNGSVVGVDCSQYDPQLFASTMTTALQENDRIFMLDGLTDGTETNLVPATD